VTRIAAPPARNEVAAIRLLLASELLVQPERGAASPLIGKDGALLAWLAIEGPTSRERMARLLWPESDDEAARNALRQRIFKLRKVAGGEIVVGRTTLALAAGITHDLDGSAHLLGKADARLTGELAGWLDQQRQQRHLGARQLLIDRILAAEARGDPSAALPFAHELLSLDMLSEDAHRRLIRLHYAAGDRPLAMRAFERCESMLRSELGVSPSDETVALMKVVQGSEAATRADRAAVAAPFGSLPASVLRPPRRIGREAVWAALARAVAERSVGERELERGHRVGALPDGRVEGEADAKLPSVAERIPGARGHAARCFRIHTQAGLRSETEIGRGFRDAIHADRFGELVEVNVARAADRVAHVHFAVDVRAVENTTPEGEVPVAALRLLGVQDLLA